MRFYLFRQVKIHYAVHYSRSAQLAAGPAIDGRLLADSDLRDRRYLAAGAMNEEPQDNNQVICHLGIIRQKNVRAPLQMV